MVQALRQTYRKNEAEININIYCQFIYYKDAKNTHWRKVVFSTNSIEKTG